LNDLRAEVISSLPVMNVVRGFASLFFAQGSSRLATARCDSVDG
jgi:hypothetical protein